MPRPSLPAARVSRRPDSVAGPPTAPSPAAVPVLGLALLLASVAALPAQESAADRAFRDALDEPPPGWEGPVFELSDDYPEEHPGECPEAVCTWLALDVDFSADLEGPPPTWKDTVWAEYIGRVLDYVKEGQGPDLDGPEGFRVKVDGETRWFHVPWMAYDETTGREFVHGTTNERTAHLGDLVGPQGGVGASLIAGERRCEEEFPHGFETWAVGVYNPWGGWSLGRAWPRTGPDAGEPRVGEHLGRPMPEGLPFPEGTVVAKFLTTNAPPRCVPFLEGAPEWRVHRHSVDPETGAYRCEREVQTSRLVQVDVAVVDSRSPTRWVYGTFAYDGTVESDDVWDRLVPVGLQWGSDPWTFPAVPSDESVPARQSVLNTGLDIYEHFGCNGRLAGPVDNAKSSCLSCHGSSFAAPAGTESVMGVNVPPSFGFEGVCSQYSAENARYFQNTVAPQGYPGGQYPGTLNLDTSLQMWVAFQQYGIYATEGEPKACTNPNQF